MPGVVSVQPRVGGLLSQVAQAVQVARDVYGIKHEMTVDDATEQATEQNKQKFEDEQAGILPGSSRLGALHYGVPVDQGTPNAIKTTFRTGPGQTEDVYMLPKTKPESGPVLTHVQNALINGKHGAATYDPSLMNAKDPNAGLVGFVETARAPGPAKEPRLMAVDAVDADGNPVKKVVEMTPGAEYSTIPKGAAKATEAQNKAYTEMTGKVSGGRGAPPAVQDAMKGQVSVNKALEIINSAPNGDINQISPQQFRLLNSEIAKIAQGGVPSEAEQKGLDPHTFASQWSELKNRFTGPTGQIDGAQLGAFIKQNQAYLNGLGGVLNDVVSKYQRGTFDDYADSGRISEDHQTKFKARHPGLFPEEGGAPAKAAAPQSAQPVASNGFVETANAGGGATQPNAALHPEAESATKWALDYLKKNPKGPDARKAQEVLRRVNQGVEQKPQDKGLFDTVKGWFD